MATVTVTSDTFEKLVEDNDIVILDFWASWCGPCRAFAPIFEAASDTHADIAFGKIDTEDQQQLAAQFGIRSIPTLAVYRGQIPIFMQPGMLPAPALEELIQKVRELDMTEVKQKWAEQQAQA